MLKIPRIYQILIKIKSFSFNQILNITICYFGLLFICFTISVQKSPTGLILKRILMQDLIQKEYKDKIINFDLLENIIIYYSHHVRESNLIKIHLFQPRLHLCICTGHCCSLYSFIVPKFLVHRKIVIKVCRFSVL